MACFRTWTVLNNEPIETFSDNLWGVQGFMPDGKNRRRMIVARRSDGDLVIHNVIALDEAGMARLEAFGRVRYMVVPNAFHRQDAYIWKQRFPDMLVVAPAGARGAVEKEVRVDLDYDQLPPDDVVRLGHNDGLAKKEGFMLTQGPDGATLTYCDTLLNMPPMSGIFGFLLSPTGKPSLPRLIRWMMVKDKAALAAQLRSFADRERIVRIIPGHGSVMDAGAPEVLRNVAEQAAS